MPTPVDVMLVPVHTMTLLVPTDLAQGRLVTDLAANDTPMIHGPELVKRSSMFHHHLT